MSRADDLEVLAGRLTMKPEAYDLEDGANAILDLLAVARAAEKRSQLVGHCVICARYSHAPDCALAALKAGETA